MSDSELEAEMLYWESEYQKDVDQGGLCGIYKSIHSGSIAREYRAEFERRKLVELSKTALEP